MQTLKSIVMGAFHQGLLGKGLHEVCKSIESKKVKFCVLAQNCDEQHYVKLVKALCKENSIPLLLVEDGVTLGEWIKICKYDANNTLRKKRKCSSLAIKDYPPEISEEEITTIDKQFN